MLQRISHHTFYLLLTFWLLGLPLVMQSQSYDPNRWNDLYNYTNVKKIALSNSDVYATVATGAFSYNKLNGEKEKRSTVNGLSGEVNSAILYAQDAGTLFIGYENGLMELIRSDGSVRKVVDILLSDVSATKKINSFYSHNNKLYLSLQFGIVVYDMIDEEFINTYYIGANSSLVDVSSVTILGDYIYASSDNGVYIANLNSNLNDSDNWNLNFSGAFDNLIVFNGDVLVSTGNEVQKIVGQSTLELAITVSENIIDLATDQVSLIVGALDTAEVYDVNYSLDHLVDPAEVDITSVAIDGSSIYLGTDGKGVLLTQFNDVTSFEEISIPGPERNELFALAADKGHLWVVYGGYTSGFNFSGIKMGPSHYDGNSWVHLPYDTGFDPRDLSDVAIDPSDVNRVYLSSYYKGVLVVENNESVRMINHANNNLGYWQHSSSFSLITTSQFDREGNLWVANSWGKDTKILNKLENEMMVAEFDFSSVVDRGEQYSSIYDMAIGADNKVWLGTYREGLLVTDGATTPTVKRLTLNQDNLPSNTVKAVAADHNNRIWIGTNHGLVVFDDAENVFTNNYQKPEPVIIVVDGVASELLGDATINDIYVDGANNKWFATGLGGVIQTNATGQKILASFTTENSPLPTNDVLKVEMDESTGIIYFLTTKGILSYNTGITPYGEQLSEVYGYPNPSLKQHNTVSLVGKDGSNLPEGTNVKILDVAGNLVFESNTIESQSSFGGKIIWDKTNLAGQKVASGVYIVLMYNEEGEQTASTKIAIIN